VDKASAQRVRCQPSPSAGRVKSRHDIVHARLAISFVSGISERIERGRGLGLVTKGQVPVLRDRETSHVRDEAEAPKMVRVEEQDPYSSRLAGHFIGGTDQRACTFQTIGKLGSL